MSGSGTVSTHLRDLEKTVRQLPVSCSLHSVSLPPAESAPGVVAVTLRHSGQVRVVHGGEEVYSAVRRAVAQVMPNDKEGATSEAREKNGAWCCSIKKGVFNSREGNLLSCQLLENLIRLGWEVLSSGELSVTSGFELVTWLLRKVATPPLHNAVLASLVFTEPAKVEVVAVQDHVQVNNAVRRAIAEVEANSQGASANGALKDDPACGPYFSLDSKQVDVSRLVLEMTQLLFCRQWRLVATAKTPFGGQHETLFFCRDGRILPSLGQKAFAMVEIQKPDLVRLHCLNSDCAKAVVDAVASVTKQEITQEKDDAPSLQTLRVSGQPWRSRAASSDLALSEVMLALNRRELNVYGRVTLAHGQTRQSTLVIFRQSNVTFSKAMVIRLVDANKLEVFGGSEAELSVLRSSLTSRWPYPLVRDASAKTASNGWAFKVRRFPWAVSYGSATLDRLAEALRPVAERHGVAIPDPSNMDAESAKSVIAFMLRDLLELGWRPQMWADVSAARVVRTHVHNARTDPHALFLMR